MLDNREVGRMITNAAGKRERLAFKLDRCRTALEKMEEQFELKYGIDPRHCAKETLRTLAGGDRSDHAFWDYCAIESKLGEIRALTDQICKLDSRIAEFRGAPSAANDNEYPAEDGDFDMGR